MTRIDKLIGGIRELSMWEMAKIPKELSGLPYDIHLWSEGSDDKEIEHGPRVKVYPEKVGGPSFEMIVMYPPDVKVGKELASKSGKGKLELIAKWAVENKEHIQKFWDGEINDPTIKSVVKKVEQPKVSSEQAIKLLNSKLGSKSKDVIAKLGDPKDGYYQIKQLDNLLNSVNHEIGNQSSSIMKSLKDKSDEEWTEKHDQILRDLKQRYSSQASVSTSSPTKPVRKSGGGGGTWVKKKGPHGKIYVKGFMKKDGTKVDPYWRDYRDEVCITPIDKLIRDCKQFLGEIPDRL